MDTKYYIGTSGWHYNHWIGKFYPANIKGYYELKYHSEHFNTVENNSSFYRIASENTYKTWDRMTPEHYRFSMKLNKWITHIYKLEVNEDVMNKVKYVLDTTQVLKDKLGAIVIQLPPSFKYDLPKLETFLKFFTKEIKIKEYKFDVAIEFRNKHWLIEDVYSVLRKYNVAIVAANSSRYPGTCEVTADIAYIRLHGPEKLFASKYSEEQLTDWANYIRKISPKVQRVYVYFNNDFHGYALEDAKVLSDLLNN